MRDNGTDPMVVVCKGPPICMLEGDAACAAIEAGCPWCKRIVIHPDGSETVYDVPIA